MSPLKYSPFREFDLDDFIVLKLFGEGARCCDIAKYLNVTRPAISRRMNKYARMWPEYAVNTEDIHKPRRFSTEVVRRGIWAAKILHTLVGTSVIPCR